MSAETSTSQSMVRRWGGQIAQIAAIVLVVLVAKGALAEPFYVPSASMEPTLLIGDALLASKYPYGYSTASLPIHVSFPETSRVFGELPKRGDVVVFRWPGDRSQVWVKRVIGLPGDRIQMRAGRLYINDALVARRSIGRFDGDQLYVETLPNGREHEIIEISDADRHDDTPVFTVPAGHYFMMGDNRDNSLDSRIPTVEGGVGFVPEENLVARADRLLFSRDPSVGWLDVADWAHAFRLVRLFGRID
jgi:signal peptidase I